MNETEHKMTLTMWWIVGVVVLHAPFSLFSVKRAPKSKMILHFDSIYMIHFQ